MELHLWVMSLEHFWGSSTDKMPPKPPKETLTADKSQLCQDGNAPELDPATARAMEVLTANFTTVIDNKLERMLDSINSNISQHLKEIGDRVGEAEGRILELENTSSKTEKHITGLTKSGKELTERLQDFENQGRWKNMRILGIREKLEGSDVVKFMEKWILAWKLKATESS